MDRMEFDMILETVAALTGEPVSRDRGDRYYRHLQDLPAAAVALAAKRALGEKLVFPAADVLRRLALKAFMNGEVLLPIEVDAILMRAIEAGFAADPEAIPAVLPRHGFIEGACCHLK